MNKKHTIVRDGNPQSPVLDEYIEPISLPPTHGLTLIKSNLGGQASFCLTPEYDILINLRRLLRFVRQVETTHLGEFQLFKKKRVESQHRPDLRSEAMQLIAFLKMDWADIKSILPGHVFNPYITSFITTMQKFPALEDLARFFPRLSPNEYQNFLEALQSFVNQLRERVQSAAFKLDLHTISKRCRKNHRSSINYVRSLFKYRGTKHLAIRLDLAYRMEESIFTGSPQSISAEEARIHMAAFVRLLRRHYPVTGHLWSLEYGLYTAYHFHFLVFLNGHLHQQDNIAWQLGEMWEGPTTNGTGIFFNCNASEYWKRGIGMIRAEDTAKREILEMNVLPYLTKADFLSSIKGGRWFGRGDMPRAFQTKAGRPRLEPHPLHN